MAASIPPDNEPRGRPGAGAVLFAYGFRPFFLMAGVFSVLAMAVWIAVYAGALPAVPPFAAPLWHAHEMLFGFTGAVVAGFLLTAAPTWTGAAPVTGGRLMGLACLWLAGRIALWAPVSAWLAAALDIAFLPALGAAILPALIRGSRKQLVFLAVLGLLTLANLLFHLEALGVAQTGSLGLLLAVDSVALFIAIIGGRVTPAFTANALRERADLAAGEAEIASRPWLDKAAIASVALVIVVDLAFRDTAAAGILALAAAGLNGLRMAGWKGAKVLGHPILWVLHLGYGWLVLGLAVKGLAAVTGALAPAAALHGITIGAIGTMTLAMMSRASLGHTGRPLRVGRWLALAYLLPTLAVAVRLVTPLAAPEYQAASITLSGLLWLAAFAIFAALFAPILVCPRADGRPG